MGETEYARIRRFMQELLDEDNANLISLYVFDEQVGLIDALMNNQYLFRNFWISIHIQEEGWMEEYRDSWDSAFWYCYRSTYIRQKSSIWSSIMKGFR